ISSISSIVSGRVVTSDPALLRSGSRPRVTPTSDTVSVPLRQLDHDAFKTTEEHQLAAMEIHDLVAPLDADRLQPCDLRHQVVDREADMVESQLVEAGEAGLVGDGRLAVAQQLHLEAWLGTLQHLGDMLGLDARDAHISVHDRPFDDGRDLL